MLVWTGNTCVIPFAFPLCLIMGCAPKDIIVGSWEQHSPKPSDDSPKAPTLLDDVHERRGLFFGHFGPDVAFPTKPQRLPFLRESAEFSWGLGLFKNGLSRLHAGSVILGFF